MRSIALGTDWDIARAEVNGLKTISIACGHRAVFQLVRTGLIASKLNRQVENPLWIDWFLFTFNRDLLPLLAPRIIALIGSFKGVQSVDISNAEINENGEYLSVTGICFTVDCDNSAVVCEVSA